MGEKLNLAGAWNTTMATVKEALGGFFEVATIIGVLAILFGFVMFFWQKRRGGGNKNGIIFVTLFGALLAAPGALMPAILEIIDFVGNIMIQLFNSAIN